MPLGMGAFPPSPPSPVPASELPLEPLDPLELLAVPELPASLPPPPCKSLHPNTTEQPDRIVMTNGASTLRDDDMVNASRRRSHRR